MKKMLRIFSIIFTIVKLSSEPISNVKKPYINNKVFDSLKNISISKILDFEKIVVSVEDDFDNEQFYHIMAFEIDSRMSEDQLEKEIFNLRVDDALQKGVMIYVAEKK